MKSRTYRRQASAHGEARAWKERHDQLLDVLGIILEAHGSGPEKRLAIAKVYADRAQRRPIAVEPVPGGDHYVIYFPMVTPGTVTPDADRWPRWLERLLAALHRITQLGGGTDERP